MPSNQMCDMFEIWLIIGQQVIYDSLNLKPRIVYILKVFKLWNVKQKMYKLQTLPPQNVWFYNVSLLDEINVTASLDF